MRDTPAATKAQAEDALAPPTAGEQPPAADYQQSATNGDARGELTGIEEALRKAELTEFMTELLFTKLATKV